MAKKNESYNQLNISEEKQEEIFDYVVELFKKEKEKRDLLDEKVKRWLKLWNSIPDGEKEDWEHDCFVGYTFALTKTAKPRIVAALFNDPMFLRITAEDEKYIHSETAIRNYYIQELKNKGFMKKTRFAVNDALSTPCGWIFVQLYKVDKDVDWDMSVIDYFDIWCGFKQMEIPRWLFHRLECSLNQVNALTSSGYYNDKLEDLMGTKYPDDIPNIKAEIQGYHMSRDDITFESRAYEKNKFNGLYDVEIMKWWGAYDIDGTGIDRKILVTVGNRNKNCGLRIEPYEDRIPYFPVRICKTSRYVYGKPIPQQIEQDQEELNDLRSLRADAAERQLNTTFKARKTAMIDFNTIFQAPGHVIELEELDDLGTIDTVPTPQSAYSEEEIIKSDAQLKSGAYDYMRISGSTIASTATGMNMITSESATRFRDDVEDIAEDILELIKFIAFKIQKYCTRAARVRIANSSKIISLTPEEIKAGYRFDIGISNINNANKDLRLQLLINIINVIGNVRGVNIYELIAEVLSYGEIRNIEKILPMLGDSEKERQVREFNALIKHLKDVNLANSPGNEEGMDRVINNVLKASNESAMIGSPLNPTASGSVQNPVTKIMEQTGVSAGV